MSEPKYTPGPWDWLAIGANASGGFHLYIIDASKRKIAALWGKAAEKEANARLIAAAPDLLEALKRLLVEASAAGLTDAKDFGWPDAISKARTAIAKATA